MKKITTALAAAAAFGLAAQAHAATFTPTFDEPSFPGTQFDVTDDFNAVYAEAFGITVTNAYLYVDSRDTFDGIGIANGNVGEIGTQQSGRIDFLDTTDFVSIDFLALQSSTYEAYSVDGVLIDSFTASSGTGTMTLDGGIIAYVLFTGTGGFTTISSLTYNYDGVTGGGNQDLGAVPVPGAAILFVTAAGAAGALRRRKA